MHGDDGNWDQAFKDLMEAFKNYIEMSDIEGSLGATRCFKYAVLANMIARGSINPFESKEAKRFESCDDIKFVRDMRYAFERNDVEKFRESTGNIKQQSAAESRNNGEEDWFVKHIETATVNFYKQVIVKTVKPYNRCHLSFLADVVGENVDYVEIILMQLILDRELSGRINQVAGILDLSKARMVVDYHAMNEVTKELGYALGRLPILIDNEGGNDSFQKMM